ncbi:NAD(P)-dependent alcohol dehydrogenase [Deinococcus cellulosilyticus]|uniref:Sorbitol dehydrogenase n=1 Tax=Deinococcus cellulosilyticus (strain DSM 18568 / NBRC 106333 / KACC 11606 / 5516J-15) TaxID=1223518 RepID=A0A511MY48_DEIC1|nr:NAD(P)-dependent alcohol dehydrogenase [Deinococcus cellulosilyticus]GEM45483.1 sorbitol dehydrogenase [Deinococcus cellulosilyticus NBRC 106333 = KACC 11606]
MTTTPHTMKAAVLHAIRDVRIEERPIPPVRPGHVRVRIRTVGVCGSDVHYFTHGRIGPFVVESPIILGHESMGVIEDIGEGVKHLQPGDRVTLEPGYPCRTCECCKSGRYNLCPEMTFMATPPVNGAFVEHLEWPADFVFRVPDSVSDDAAALIEPLAVGVWSVQRGGVKPGDAIVVYGAGPIGCTTLQAAKTAGATTLIAVDLEEYRLDLIRELGATHTINARHEDVLARIREITRRNLPESHSGADVVFETAGNLRTCQQSMLAARPGGVVVLVGLPPNPQVELDLVAAASREVDIRGIFRYANCYPAALRLVEEGRVNLDRMVTHRYPLDQAGEALSFADEFKHVSMKVMVDV